MAKVVGITYGPRGRTVMLDRPGGLLSTKDGVTVAWEVEPDDPLRRMGTRMLQEACAKVNTIAGDGTTTTAILTAAIIKEAHKYIVAGANPQLLANDLRRVAEELDECDLWAILGPIQVEDPDLLYEVALTASNHDSEIAKAILDSLDMVGIHGIVSVEEGSGRGIELIQKSGLEINGGLASTDLLMEDGAPRHMDVALVAVVDAELTSLDHVKAIIEEGTGFPHPLVIVSRGCFGEALKTICLNDRKLKDTTGRTVEIVAVTARGHLDQQREYLRDLAALAGAQILDPKTGVSFSDFKSEQFGSVQSCLLKQDLSTFVAFEDKFESIEKRVEELLVKKSHTESTYDIEQLDERMARLTDGFCVMKVGAATSTEIRERRGRIEDSLNAVRCAVDGGIVPGGGISYLALSNFLAGGLKFSHKMLSYNRGDLAVSGVGDRVLVKALRAPLSVLAENAGHEAPVVLERVLAAPPGVPCWKTGWDATTNEVRNFRESPVIADPLEIVKAVVLTSISTAATLLTAEVAIIGTP